MAIYFKSSLIPCLKNYRFNQRAQILAIAMAELPVPKKMMLNILKLALLSILFIWLARSFGSSEFIMPLLGIVLGYPLVIHPIMYKTIEPLLPNAIEKFEKEQARIKKAKGDAQKEDEEDEKEDEEKAQ
ncbi:hypothetical protein HR060_13070 [Catenovulum sp. SM1970]|uniref:DUF6170 family protein n=1 Tax=Marinifaba aquimaris TaxID=2741323 RepID=UPI001572633C|nr:DUF6170 family protein [Marinifaba aquimaris]NTS77790.1 hypothetical protein [Marinifaba aquimaris]